MSEGNKKVELQEEELEKVSGGGSDYEEYGGYKQIIGTQKVGYCKFCHDDKLLEFVGEDCTYYHGEYVGVSNLWKCCDCQNVNYYLCNTGKVFIGY